MKTDEQINSSIEWDGNKKNFFYLINEENYLICDQDRLPIDETCIELSFQKMVDNRQLLEILRFGFFNNVSDRTKAFAAYLSSFGNLSLSEKKYKKLLTNPVIRIFFQDEEMLKAAKNVL